MKRVLVIGGFDPSGGAGLLMDVKMLTLFGLACASVPTALTFQSTKIFEAWKPLESKDFERMLKLTLLDLPPVGVKIGMLATPEIVSISARYLKKYRTFINWVVYDPVLRATLGAELSWGGDFLEVLKRELLPLVDFLTPNQQEASILTNREITSSRDLKHICTTLRSYGVRHVAITGLRKKGRIYNYYLGEEERLYSTKELPYEFHGTGCALSSLLLAYLLRDYPPPEAIFKAMRRLSYYLRKAPPLQVGQKLRLIL